MVPMIGARYNRAVICQFGNVPRSWSQAALTKAIEGEVVSRDDEYPKGNVNPNHPGEGHEVVYKAE